MLTAETKEVEMFKLGREGMEKQGLNMNLNKTKYLVTGKEAKEKMQYDKLPCGCCEKGVGRNSILCSEFSMHFPLPPSLVCSFLSSHHSQELTDLSVGSTPRQPVSQIVVALDGVELGLLLF